jgi:hypothetical protein
MSAFLYEEALNKKGFDEAISLVYSVSDGDQLFANLKKVLAVDETNFHNTIVQLIN